MRHLVERHGTAVKGGLRFYLLDNEPGIWHGTHRDVQPVGIKAEALRDRILAYAAAIKAVDPGAQVVAPEEWGCTGYIYSPYDHWYGGTHGWSNLPEHGGVQKGRDFMPWLLNQLRQNNARTGKRLVDVFTAHIYPQGGEFGNDTSPAMQDRRNRSTRSLWDPNYTDESWIKEKVRLIPRLKEWVKENYPGTAIGITEYNWGVGEPHQRRDPRRPTFSASSAARASTWRTALDDARDRLAGLQRHQALPQLRRQRLRVWDVSVGASAPDPDKLSVFAALRSSHGALTVMVVSKSRGVAPIIGIDLSHFTASGPAQTWQFTAANKIERVADTPLTAKRLQAAVPAQSVTLFVVPAAR